MKHTNVLDLLLKLVLLPVVLQGVTQLHGQSRTVVYQWLNTPCSENLNCEGGCSACNEPAGEDLVVFGTNAAFIGVHPCPHPIASGDNALALSGWGAVADDAHRILISGIAQVPIRIDSVVVVHRREENGPTHVAIQLKDLNDGSGVASEAVASPYFATTELMQCGTVEKPEGMGFGSFQLQLQAFGGSGGDWVLDEVRIVTTPLVDGITTGLVHHGAASVTNTAPAVTDLLGRNVRLPLEGPVFRKGSTIIVP
jgi:hypothetical protein